MTVAIERRLDSLERDAAHAAPQLLPRMVPDATTDAEIAELRRSGIAAYRYSDPAFIDLFV